MSKEQVLLTQITEISKKYDLLYQKAGGYFNVFEIVDSAHDEITICKVLYELLSPTGSHYQGASYLKLFFENVLHLPISDVELGTARVFREYRIDEQRRIDLVIETAAKFIPIEVKIYAGEQEKQCFDYFTEAKIHTNDPKIYYLTRFGSEPSDYSANGLLKNNDNTYQDIILISFANDILNWLALCLGQSNTLKIAPIRETLIQFIDVIRKFTDKMEDEKELEVKKLLTSSPDNMKSGVTIYIALDAAREEMMLRLLTAIEAKVGIQKLNNQYDFQYNNTQKVKSFYSRKHSTYPGISYLYKTKDEIKADKDIWVRIEIDYKIFVGYCCPVNDTATNKTLSEQEIKSILNVEPCTDNWWAYWEYCPNDNETLCPDFKEHNEAYYDLFDNAKFDTLVNCCAEKIKNLLK